MSQNPSENVPEVASHDLLSFEDRCRAWLEKQPNHREKVELGMLLMIPLMELSPAQLARLSELRKVLGDNAEVRDRSGSGTPPQNQTP
jgi:hypothetical protein